MSLRKCSYPFADRYNNSASPKTSGIMSRTTTPLYFMKSSTILAMSISSTESSTYTDGTIAGIGGGSDEGFVETTSVTGALSINSRICLNN